MQAQQHDHEDSSAPSDLADMYESASWDEAYSGEAARWSGNPNAQLVREATALTPGRALDIGCGEGADAVWLARRGWQVTGLDFSSAALERAAENARRSGVEDRVQWRQADIRTWRPDGERWDLVSSQFMHQPGDGMVTVVRTLASAVADGGTLLVVGHHPMDAETGLRHGPVVPGGHADAHRGAHDLFAPEDVLPALDPEAWEIVTDVRGRPVPGAEGGDVTVRDSVLLGRRRGAQP